MMLYALFFLFASAAALPLENANDANQPVLSDGSNSEHKKEKWEFGWFGHGNFNPGYEGFRRTEEMTEGSGEGPVHPEHHSGEEWGPRYGGWHEHGPHRGPKLSGYGYGPRYHWDSDERPFGEHRHGHPPPPPPGHPPPPPLNGEHPPPPPDGEHPSPLPPDGEHPAPPPGDHSSPPPDEHPLPPEGEEAPAEEKSEK